MEARKIKGEAKSVVLDNGAEITYCERGEEHEEVIICGAFYHHTVMPVIEGLAERFHVYGVVMRMDGEADQLNPDGSVHWGRQWGKDVYDFAKKLGIDRFHYFGKCHGTVPGWWLVKEHPECLLSFESFYLAPHLLPQNSNKWAELLAGGNAVEAMRVAMRKPEEGLPKKMEELAALGDDTTPPQIMMYGGFAEKLWDDAAEMRSDLESTQVKVAFLFGSMDPLFQDHYDSNMEIWKVVPDCRFTVLNGECHLMELDAPERVVAEVFIAIDESKKSY